MKLLRRQILFKTIQDGKQKSKGTRKGSVRIYESGSNEAFRME